VLSTDVLLFDLFGTLVDPISISRELNLLLPAGPASRVAALWRRKQLEYAFRLTIMHMYQDFEWVTARALEFALAACDQELTAPQREHVLSRYQWLEPFEDVPGGLERLTTRGCRLAVLSNGSPRMIHGCLTNAGLDRYFPTWISAADTHVFKPDLAVYHLAAERLHEPLDRLWLVSSNPFDVVGAKAAGLKAVWIRRVKAPFDTIGEAPDLIVTSMHDLADKAAAPTPPAGL
jgi:2-haloacid dehalogenase